MLFHYCHVVFYMFFLWFLQSLSDFCVILTFFPSDLVFVFSPCHDRCFV